MAKITMGAKEILADIKAGMDNTDLMQRYGLSDKGLQTVFNKLVDLGVLKQEELEKRSISPLRAELMEASLRGKSNGVELLLDEGADINARDKNGQTVLMAASSEAHVDVVKLLLARGADINAKGEDGLTALTAASSQGRQEVVNILEAHRAT